MKITIIGAGNMGCGLAMRFAKANHEVTIGSFDPALAQEAAERSRTRCGCDHIYSGENREAAAWGDVVIVVIPSAAHREVLEELKDVLHGKVFLDITVPMAINPIRYAPPAEGSNAQQAQAILGEGCHVTAGFHTISAKLLGDLDNELSGSAFVVGSDEESIQTAMALGKSIGLQVVNAGGLQFAHTIESLTPMLLGINKRYGSNHAGIDVTGI